MKNEGFGTNLFFPMLFILSEVASGFLYLHRCKGLDVAASGAPEGAPDPVAEFIVC